MVIYKFIINQIPGLPAPRPEKRTCCKAKPIFSRYKFQLHEARRDVRAVVRTKLVVATGNPHAEMIYTREERTGERKVIHKHHVDVEAWPEGWIPFAAPSYIGSVRKLRCIADGFRSGAIWFRRMGAAEVARRARVLGLVGVEARRARADADEVRPLRPLDTRSKRLRNGTGINTRPVVTEEEDVQAGIWPDAIEEAVAAPASAPEEEDEIEEWED